MVTEAERAQREADRIARMAIIEPHLVEGITTLTHTRCMGIVEEHIFTGMDGIWLRGWPTSDTLRIERNREAVETSDISPLNVTHINRVPIDCLELVSRVDDRPPAGTAGDYDPAEREAAIDKAIDYFPRQEVQAIAYVMEARLKANDHKPGWKADDPKRLMYTLDRERDNLNVLVNAFGRTDKRGKPCATPAEIADAAADVANMAMMIADVAGGFAEQDVPF